MQWFLDTLLGYIMMDVVDVEFGKLKELLSRRKLADVDSTVPKSPVPHSDEHESDLHQDPKLSHQTISTSHPSTSNPLDFTTLRTIHTTYLDRLLTGCLLTNSVLTSTLRSILDVCERFVAQVERWGGDVLPALLSEGSLKGGDEKVGAMVKERGGVVAEINEVRFSQRLDD
jgi:hypothetical protein